MSGRTVSTLPIRTVGEQMADAAVQRLGPADGGPVRSLGSQVDEALRESGGEAAGVLNAAEADRLVRHSNAVGPLAAVAFETLLAGLAMPNGTRVTFAGNARQIIEKAQRDARICPMGSANVQVCVIRQIRQ